MGYECKDIDYSNWMSEYSKKILDQNTGYMQLVTKGTIDEYKFMFRNLPSNDLINWLNVNSIPWDYCVI